MPCNHTLIDHRCIFQLLEIHLALSSETVSILNYLLQPKWVPGVKLNCLKREEIHVYLQLIHVAIRQKPTQHCKAIILQLKFFLGKNMFPRIHLMNHQAIREKKSSTTDWNSHRTSSGPGATRWTWPQSRSSVHSFEVSIWVFSMTPDPWFKVSAVMSRPRSRNGDWCAPSIALGLGAFLSWAAFSQSP